MSASSPVRPLLQQAEQFVIDVLQNSPSGLQSTLLQNHSGFLDSLSRFLAEQEVRFGPTTTPPGTAHTYPPRFTYASPSTPSSTGPTTATKNPST